MKAEKRTMNKHLAALGLFAGAGLVRAHEGHGLPGVSHWHPDDVLVLLVAAAVAGLALWLTRRK
jgi:hypothetical protein